MRHSGGFGTKPGSQAGWGPTGCVFHGPLWKTTCRCGMGESWPNGWCWWPNGWRFSGSLCGRGRAKHPRCDAFSLCFGAFVPYCHKCQRHLCQKRGLAGQREFVLASAWERCLRPRSKPEPVPSPETLSLHRMHLPRSNRVPSGRRATKNACPLLGSFVQVGPGQQSLPQGVSGRETCSRLWLCGGDRLDFCVRSKAMLLHSFAAGWNSWARKWCMVACKTLFFTATP